MRRVLSALVLFCLVQASFCLEWERISPYPTAANLNSLAYGNGAMVAVGDGSIIYSTVSGNTWKEVRGLPQTTFSGLKFGNGVFVAVTGDGRAFVSSNGFNWSSHAVSTAGLSSLIFGNGLFAAGANNGIIATSTNGVAWNSFSGISSANLHLGDFGNGTFFFKEFGSGNNMAVISTNGVDWRRSVMLGIPHTVQASFPPGPSEPFKIRGLAFGNGVFAMAVHYEDFGFNTVKYFASSDGLTWTDTAGSYPNRTLIYVTQADILDYENGEFVQLWSSEGPLLSSSNLVNWSPHSIPAGVSPGDLLFDGSSFVVVGGAGLALKGASLDSLQRMDNPEKSAELVSVAARGDVMVGVGNLVHGVPNLIGRYELVVSTNGGRVFQRATAPVPFRTLSSVRDRDGTFVAVGSLGAAWRSTNGLSWSASTPVTGESLMDVDFIGGRWIAVGNRGTVLTSSNAVEFAQVNSGTDINLTGVAGGNGAIVAVGASGSFLRSTDAVNWTLGGTDEGTELWSVAFGGGRFVAVGSAGRVYISEDGVEWSSKRIIGANALSRVAFAHGLFVTIEAMTEKSFHSTNGTNWTQVTIPGAALLGADASNGRHFVSGLAVIYGEKMDFPISAVIASDGKFQLSWGADAAEKYSIFSISDVSTANWNLVGTVTNTGGVAQWVDANSVEGSRFFRVRRD